MTRFKRLLVATDFSPGADRAVERAARLALQHGSEIELLHVISHQPLQMLARLAPDLMDDPEAGMLDAAETELRRVAGQWGKLRISSRAVTGVPYRKITERATEIGADLTVIGAHGRHFVKTLFSGTTMQRVARAAKGSVLIVRADGKKSYEKILAPVDFSGSSCAILEAATAIAPDATLNVLHAYDPLFEGKARYAGVSDDALAHYRKAVESEARKHMDSLIAKCLPKDSLVTRIVKRGYAPGVIEQVIQDRNVDLVVMGAQGDSEASRFFLGSVSLHVLLEAQVDVLLVRVPTAPAAA